MLNNDRFQVFSGKTFSGVAFAGSWLDRNLIQRFGFGGHFVSGGCEIKGRHFLIPDKIAYLLDDMGTCGALD